MRNIELQMQINNDLDYDQFIVKIQLKFIRNNDASIGEKVIKLAMPIYICTYL